MKKTIIILLAAFALISFSCNRYCHCKHYIDGVLDKDYKDGKFVNELGNCEDYNSVHVFDGVTDEVKCK